MFDSRNEINREPKRSKQEGETKQSKAKLKQAKFDSQKYNNWVLNLWVVCFTVGSVLSELKPISGTMIKSRRSGTSVYSGVTHRQRFYSLDGSFFLYFLDVLASFQSFLPEKGTSLLGPQHCLICFFTGRICKDHPNLCLLIGYLSYQWISGGSSCGGALHAAKDENEYPLFDPIFCSLIC